MAEATEGSGTEQLSSSLQKRLDLVKAQIDRLAFGSIAVIIHDGKVVQLELTERRRFT